MWHEEEAQEVRKEATMHGAEVDAVVESDSRMKDLAHRVGFTVDALHDENKSTYIILNAEMKQIIMCSLKSEVLAFLAGVMCERCHDS